MISRVGGFFGNEETSGEKFPMFFSASRRMCLVDVGVSKNRMIWWYHHFWKHPLYLFQHLKHMAHMGGCKIHFRKEFLVWLKHIDQGGMIIQNKSSRSCPMTPLEYTPGPLGQGFVKQN